MTFLSLAFAALLLQAPSLHGSVTRRGSSEAVPHTVLELKSIDGATKYSVATQDDGRFAFQNIAPGKYTLSAEHPGYVRTEYGQRKASGHGTVLEMTATGVADDLSLVLTPTASISGRIYNEQGQPVVKASVDALRATYKNGVRTLSVVQSTLANDLGEYRLFWLPPGEYYVDAAIPNWGMLQNRITVNSDAPATPLGASFGGYQLAADPLAPYLWPGRYQTPGSYLPVYYPNTTDSEAARALELEPGSDAESINLTIAPIRARQVRGVVVDGATGLPPKGLQQAPQVQAYPPVPGSSNPITDRATGAFTVQTRDVPTVIVALDGIRSGVVTLPLGDADIDGLRIPLTAGFTLNGQVSIEGTAAGSVDPKVQSVRVELIPQPEAYLPRVTANNGVPGRTGVFSVPGLVPGNYRVSVAPILDLSNAPPPIPAALHNFYVKSIRFGGADALNNPLHLEGSSRDLLTVVIGSDAVKLTGEVSGTNQKPASDCTVVLVPSNRNRYDLYRSADSDAKGAFTFDRIPPGDYKLFAWQDVPDGIWQNPDFLRLYEDRGTTVRIAGAHPPIRVILIDK